MSIVIEKNDLGGKSVYVGSVRDLAKVPAAHRRLVGRSERLALADPARYFHDLAGRAKRRPLRQWLKILADCANCFLELHTASSASFPGFPSAAYFRFILDNGSAPAVKLRSAQAIPSLPPALAEVYELIDGINHCGYGMGGELFSASDVAPFAGTEFWLSGANTVEPETCMLFYDTLNGDMLCFQPPDEAVWYVHEIGELRPVGSLRSLVDRYFRNLIQGDVLERK
jgi:hypothetical protein